MEAKKQLGQHFLINEGVALKITERLKLADLIVEIGGGKGALTEKLKELGKKTVVVELDKDLLTTLKDKISGEDNIFLVRGDGRFFKLKKSAWVCGNLPYNVSKAIIKNFVFQNEFVEKMVFMVQKEVAETICAKTAQKRFSKFSVLCQLFYDVEKLFLVKPGSFLPQPKVDSAVVEFRRKKNLPNIDKGFFSFLNQLFFFPRKTVKNNLRIPLDEEVARKRPSDLTIEEMIMIWREKWQNS
ncbi:16S rRNA (adenine(1518)-N(6)/adenine(1519)-N(6))-dimethyltransferase RsmA [Hippea maritima]|uniref:Dimethyladenosine transferase n=1 Tax=Hippea maritima (strain ATCC 700847 / DSM 10411 / MH2) TaxID=760142 RepID=F2LWP0_HIPMA|nr:16S rRNA (adenine(1518)-N(6)/adenine(1519)-N(6))-dimethyltransferase RsmA [Hippea maritima]AEA33018.1 dimethyladenosine transferase [Hippea maritima DSM 10411]